MTASDRDHLGTLRAIISEWLRAIIGIRTYVNQSGSDNAFTSKQHDGASIRSLAYQSGNGNTVTLDQSGITSSAYTDQSGNNNVSKMTIAGNNGNVGSYYDSSAYQPGVRQSGNSNTSKVSYLATDSHGAVSSSTTFNVGQTGNFNGSTITQGGTDNNAQLLQGGNYNTSGITQDGSANTANVMQTSDYNTSTISQIGTNSSATVTQGH